MDIIPNEHYYYAVLGVFSLLLLVLFVLKKGRFLKFRPTSDLDVIKTIHLGSKEKLLLVEVESIKVLLGVTPHNINTLLKIGDDSASSDNVKRIQSFSAMENRMVE